MVDGHSRRINYLRVSVTDRCNLRCRYCMPKEGVSLAGHADILRYEEMLAIIKVAVKTGISKVRVTGGEPLVRRGLVDFVAAISAVEGVQEVSLTTNGILLERFALPLFEAGIRRINVSLDSLRSERYAYITGGGDFALAWAGIKAAQEVGLEPIKINIVAIKGFNDDEVLDFARLAGENALQVRFIEFMPIGGGKLGEFIANEEIRQRIESRYDLRRLPAGERDAGGPAELFQVEGGKGKIGFISPLSHSFCESCNRLRLTAVGNLRACLLDDTEVSLREVLRAGGSAADLEAMVRSVIAGKPQGHRLHAGTGKSFPRNCRREMFQIGG